MARGQNSFFLPPVLNIYLYKRYGIIRYQKAKIVSTIVR